MGLFGWTIIRVSEKEHFRKLQTKESKFWQVHRWFAGWRDLDIIWKYLIDETNVGGIERARRCYAAARNTNEYGEPNEMGRRN
jgi:hypothetical protein